MRAKARSIERAYSKLENELRRSPDDREVATELGMTESELATVLGQISFVGVVALDELLSAGAERGSGATVGDTIAGGGHDPVEAFESEEMRQVLADAINRMPDRERLVLTLYYYEGPHARRDRQRARRHREPRAARSTPRRSSSSAPACRSPCPSGVRIASL